MLRLKVLIQKTHTTPGEDTDENSIYEALNNRNVSNFKAGLSCVLSNYS